jgi:hypothetical protein
VIVPFLREESNSIVSPDDALARTPRSDPLLVLPFRFVTVKVVGTARSSRPSTKGRNVVARERGLRSRE